MSILYDARGNEIAVSFPDSLTNQTVTDARVATAVLAALNAEALIDLNGAALVSVQAVSAAAVLTYLFEGTVDGVNYFALPGFAQFQLLAGVALAEQYVPSVTIATTHSGAYQLSVAGLRRVRVRVSAYTSGTVSIAMRATGADGFIYNKPIPSNLHVTVTAAVNTAATITLPAAGVGMFHYITNINLSRVAAAAVVGGGAAQVITSTNLPGSPAWSRGDAMTAGQSLIDLDYSPTSPLKSLLANTASTIVMPIPGATILNRGNCSYYVGF